MHTFPELQLTQQPTAKLADWKAKPPRVEHVSRLLRNTALVRTETGEPVLLLVKQAFDAGGLFADLGGVEFLFSDRSSGMMTRSRTFGYNPRHAVRRDFCNPSVFNSRWPGVMRQLVGAGERIAGFYKEALPEAFAHHTELAAKILPQWRLGNTPFTSGIINQSAELPYHRDSGNFTDVWSCMLVTAHQVSGGELVIPELDAALALGDGDLLLFNGQKWMHGVAPIRRMSEQAHRYSVVYYSLKQMWQCLTVEGELARVRAVKTQRERKRGGF